MFYSCKKTQNNQSAEMKKMSATVALSTSFPTMENGILTFKTQDQFTQYIAYLDSVIDPGNYDSSMLLKQDFDQDGILDKIESTIGFNSIRRISHNNFIQLNEIGWDNLQDIPEEHFIHDAAIKSVLNVDLIVKVGNDYILYINKDLGVKVDASQKDLLEAFKKLSENATIYDVLSIDPTHQYSTSFEVMGTGIFDRNPSKTLSVGDLTIVNLTYNAPNCSKPLQTNFSNMQLMQEMDQGSYQSTSALEGTFVVSFGDGSPQQTYHSTWGQYSNHSYAIVPDFTHTYPSAGTYTLHVHAVANAVYYGATSTTADRDYSVTVSATSCKKDVFRESEDEFHTVPDGSRAWSGKVTAGKVRPWFSDKTRVISETSSWLKDGNKWKQSKAEIWHHLHTERRDNGCNVLGQVDGDGWASNSKHISTNKTDDPYYWSTVTTNHGIKYHDIWYYFGKSLSVCP
jgi:hypothetical protein